MTRTTTAERKSALKIKIEKLKDEAISILLDNNTNNENKEFYRGVLYAINQVIETCRNRKKF